MLYDLIIIGAGPAGLTAGIYAGRKKLKALILAKQTGGQALPYTIENYPGVPKINGLELVEKMKAQVEEYGLGIKDGVEISGIDKKNNNFFIKIKAGDSFEAKAIILAPGKIPRKLNIPGAEKYEGKGMSFCTTCDAPLFAGKKVAVVGGGNSALMSAMDLMPYAENIYILQHRERFVGDEILQEKLKNSNKVEFFTEAEILEIKGKKLAPNRAEGSGLGFVEGLVYKNLKTGEEKELAVGGVFVNIGYIPNTGFLENFLKLNEKKEIIIDPETGETSVKGVFAAGDATNVIYKQYVVAAGEGAKSALSAYHYICNC